MKTIEHSSDVQVIVDTDNHFALAAAHETGNPLVVFKRKVNAIAGGLPIRRVHVVKGMGPVVAFRAVKPRKVFDVGNGQPLPGLLDPQQADRRPGVAVQNVWPVTLPAQAWCCR